MAIRISIANQKGGCGKTSTAINLADALRRMNFKVLFLDCDAQANATKLLQMQPEANPGVTELILNNDTKLDDCLTATKLPNVSLIRGNIRLASVENRLREPSLYPIPIGVLKGKVRKETDFDFVLFDTPPSLSLITMNALAASDFVIVPMESGSGFSFDGLDDLLNIIATVRNSVQQDLAILGVLLTKHDSRKNVCQAVFQMVQDRFKEDCFATTISMSTAAQKAELQRDTVLQYDRKCSASRDYIALANEVVLRLKIPVPLARVKSDVAKVIAETMDDASEEAEKVTA
ncbi:MAG: ParA family protein [Nitrospira sp.]|nr:ParA family protein [Nitrospirota bacterium]